MWPWTQNENYPSPGIIVISMDIFRGFAVMFSHMSMVFSLGQNQIIVDQISPVELQPEGATRLQPPADGPRKFPPSRTLLLLLAGVPMGIRVLCKMTFSLSFPPRDLREPPPRWNMSSNNPPPDTLLQLTSPSQLQKMWRHKRELVWTRLGLVLSKRCSK